MRTYLHTRVVRVEPARDAMGRQCYRIHTPKGVELISEAEFIANYRQLDRREVTLLKLTDQELAVGAISDEPNQEPVCDHAYAPYDVAIDGWRCGRCGDVTHNKPQ